MEIKTKKKLIEVSLPLEVINKASAREKSIRHGHPSTLHLWWARRPLATARAVIFAQMVDDPSACPDIFPTEKAQEKERKRLFKIIEDLVQWENTTNEKVLEQAKAEIWQSWRRACAENVDHPQSKVLFDRNKLPAFYDPFAGGGALPLEAQRLGLESFASDLNPVAVLINKAMIEIPPKFVGHPPVNPEIRKKRDLFAKSWKGAQGLAEDLRYYGQWIRDEAKNRIGNLYPGIEITSNMVKERPDLKPYLGQKLMVVAWIWARTVKSPNPAFAKVDVPLASTFILSTKSGKEAYVDPVIEDYSYRFRVKAGKPKNSETFMKGTKLARANFRCLMSGAPISGEYIKTEFKAGRSNARLMAIVAEGDRGRVYLSPTPEHETIADQAKPTWKPDVEISGSSQYLGPKPYGMIRFSDLFTPRQLTALTTFSDLVKEAHDRIINDIPSGEFSDLENGSKIYADALAMYLAFAVDKGANYWSSVCAWHQTRDGIVSTFGRQAIPMVWDYAEANPLSDSTGNWMLGIEQGIKMLFALGYGHPGVVKQADAQSQGIANGKVISTDPPYFDNVPYADLSDFFYVWLRRSLKEFFPDLFATLTVPKVEELVAFAYRHKDKESAGVFFLNGMTQAMNRLAEQTHPAFPVTIYYAFRQAETDDGVGTASTGWETFLDAVIQAGFVIDGTWPMHTEYTGNLKINRNNLASSIVLVCRPRGSNAFTATRREFINALKNEMPTSVAHLQRGNIAPVDLAQASIGPGMAIFTRYLNVLDAEGKELTIREALTLINEVLDQVLTEQEGDFDADSRWALTWFEQSGFNDGEYGVAETLATARNTSVSGMVEAGILTSSRGKVRLLKPTELPDDWNPVTDTRLTAWEIVHHLVRVLEKGELAASELVKKLGSKAEIARELAYRLYSVCERKKRAQEALPYNALVQSWPEITRLARETSKSNESQIDAFAKET